MSHLGIPNNFWDHSLAGPVFLCLKNTDFVRHVIKSNMNFRILLSSTTCWEKFMFSWSERGKMSRDTTPRQRTYRKLRTAERERETALDFSRDEPHTSKLIPSGHPWNHMYTGNTKRTLQIIFICFCICIYIQYIYINQRKSDHKFERELGEVHGKGWREGSQERLEEGKEKEEKMQLYFN